MHTTTARPVTFHIVDADKRVRTIRQFPAGTAVHLSRFRGTFCTARVAGTLFTQRISMDSVHAPTA